jgi:hypothetical protein
VLHAPPISIFSILLFDMSIDDKWLGWERERMNSGTKNTIPALHIGFSRHDGILQETWTCHRKKTCQHRSLRV